MIPPELHILHIEDSDLDAELVRFTLENGGIPCDICWVDNFPAFVEELETNRYDLILADFSLPDCDGYKTLAVAQEKAPQTPFVLVTGAIGEELAIDSIKAGVTDYVLKSNLVRLKTAVPRAIEEARASWEKRQALADLQLSEERFELAVKGSGAGLWDWSDVNEEQMWWSPRIYELFGLDDGELPPTRSQFYTLLHPDDVAEAKAAIRRHLLERVPYDVQYRLYNKQGKLIWLRSRGKAIWDANGQATRMAGYLQDITGRKKAQEERRKLDEKYRAIIKSARDAIVMIDAAGLVTLWNPAAERMLGFSPDEILGRVLHETIMRPADQQKICLCKYLQGARKNEAAVELTVADKNGQQVPVELTASAVFQDEQWYGIGILRDISERKQAEQRQRDLEQQLRQTQKMEAIGTLAGGIAHDFNNILASILGYAAMLEKQLSVGSRQHRDLLEVLNAADRAKLLVRQILTFSRQGGQEKCPVQVGLIVKEALKLLRASLPSTIEIEQSIAPIDEVVLGDATQIHQVMMNLCTNAYHAMPKGGVLRVSLQKTDLGAANFWQLPAGPYLELQVCDTGTGIEAAILERIFDPYFTTKDAETGTGLGLSMVRGIIDGLQGKISVAGRLGEGTTFTILLPCRLFVEEEIEDIMEVTEVWGNEHILLVDDEMSLVVVGKEYLEDFGYRVTIQTGSSAALRQVQAEPGRFDLVITDLTMPHMTGIELARELKKVAPELPVILCSGLQMSLDSEGVAGTGIRQVLLKTEMFDRLPTLLRMIFTQGGDD